ncbi:MAG: hypothetical protein EHM24_32025 [Acidobacteria bacterium]|nr:MAG: hypothetical protein EHM24_32025 [Acidobacteriota bacterium]
MTGLDVESDVDRLYQLPLAEFTAARNELAKRVGGTKGAEIRALRRPPVAAWAVNQLYWRHRGAYDTLVAAAGRLREAQEAALGGGRADLREADRAYDAAVKAAFDGALAPLAESGHPASGATREAVMRTLRALPAPGRPGRLQEELSPGGFEALAGIPLGARQPPLRQPTPPASTPEGRPARRQPPGTRDEPTGRPPTEHRREEIFEATRALREAERGVRSAETAAAAAANDLSRREAEEAHAAEALAEARSRTADARHKVADARAEARRAATALERARSHLDRLRTR